MARPRHRGHEKVRACLRLVRHLGCLGRVDVEVTRAWVVDVLFEDVLEHRVEALDVRVGRFVGAPPRIQEHQGLRIQRADIQVLRIQRVDLRHRPSVGAVQRRSRIGIMLRGVADRHCPNERFLHRVVGPLDQRERALGGLIGGAGVGVGQPAIQEGAAGFRLTPEAHSTIWILALRLFERPDRHGKREGIHHLHALIEVGLRERRVGVDRPGVIAGDCLQQRDGWGRSPLGGRVAGCHEYRRD